MYVANREAVARQVLAAAKAILKSVPSGSRTTAQAFRPDILEGQILTTDDGSVDVGMTFGLTLTGDPESVQVSATLIWDERRQRYHLRFVEFGGVRFKAPPDIYIDDHPEHPPQAATA